MLPFSEIQKFKVSLLDWWTPEKERCGRITPDGEIVELTNHAEDPENNFEFALEDLEVEGSTWHTHPYGTANLSIADDGFFKSWPDKTHFIISSSEVRCFIVYNGLVHLLEDEADYPSRPPS